MNTDRIISSAPAGIGFRTPAAMLTGLMTCLMLWTAWSIHQAASYAFEEEVALGRMRDPLLVTGSTLGLIGDPPANERGETDYETLDKALREAIGLYRSIRAAFIVSPTGRVAIACGPDSASDQPLLKRLTATPSAGFPPQGEQILTLRAEQRLMTASRLVTSTDAAGDLLVLSFAELPPKYSAAGVMSDLVVTVSLASAMVWILLTALTRRALVLPMSNINALRQQLMEGNWTRTTPVSGCRELVKLAEILNAAVWRANELWSLLQWKAHHLGERDWRKGQQAADSLRQAAGSRRFSSTDLTAPPVTRPLGQAVAAVSILTAELLVATTLPVSVTNLSARWQSGQMWAATLPGLVFAGVVLLLLPHSLRLAATGAWRKAQLPGACLVFLGYLGCAGATELAPLLVCRATAAAGLALLSAAVMASEAARPTSSRIGQTHAAQVGRLALAAFIAVPLEFTLVNAFGRTSALLLAALLAGLGSALIFLAQARSRSNPIDEWMPPAEESGGPAPSSQASAPELPSPTAWQLLACVLSSLALFGAVFQLLPLQYWLKELDAGQMGRVLLAWPVGLFVGCRIHTRLSAAHGRRLLLALALSAGLVVAGCLFAQFTPSGLPMLSVFMIGLAIASDWSTLGAAITKASSRRSLALARVAGALLGAMLAAPLASRTSYVVGIGILSVASSLAIVLLQRGTLLPTEPDAPR